MGVAVPEFGEMDMWYVIQVMSGYEERVAGQCNERIDTDILDKPELFTGPYTD